MNIEEYSRKHRHLYSDQLSPLLLRLLKILTWNTFLDLGCGDGSLLYALKRSGFLKNKTVYAVDLSSTRINHVKRLDPDFRCFVDDACNLRNIRDGSIDFVASSQVIEHVSNDEQMIKEIARILTVNGTVYLTTVFRKWYGWYFYRFQGRWVLDPTHVREYTRHAELFDALGRNGFGIIENRKTMHWFPVVDMILRKMSPQDRILEKRAFRWFRKLKVPILGYYNWEIVCRTNRNSTSSRRSSHDLGTVRTK